jgi:Zn-dependent membrane protease YugP
MSGFGLYLAFLIPPLLLGFWIQHRLKTTVAREMQVPVSTGMSGEEVARRILEHNGLTDVPVQPAPGGPLSDHYDPAKRTVNLSQGVYDGHSVASVAIAAHEVGHAIQHQKAYTPFKLRSALFPAVSFASRTWGLILIAGIIFQVTGLALVAVILFAVIVLFQLVTLPVEFDASRRAKQQLSSLGLVSGGEADGASSVLSAAALTYVAGALAALTQLAYYALVFLGNRN